MGWQRRYHRTPTGAPRFESRVLGASLFHESDKTLEDFRTILAPIRESGFDVESVVIEFAKGDALEASFRQRSSGE
jgi:hypothetical protein